MKLFAEISTVSGRCPRLVPTLALGALVTVAAHVHAQGLPAEARDNIHTLLNQHDAIRRSLTLTDDGYMALTETDNPELVKALQAHVRQMEQRLGQALSVRRWDPAFAEYRAHYRDMEMSIEPVTNGVRVVVRGLTPQAVRVAQNHATVINDFVQEGWNAHDATHPAVLPDHTEAATPTRSSGSSELPDRGQGRRWRGGRPEQRATDCCRDRQQGCERPCAGTLPEPQRS